MIGEGQELSEPAHARLQKVTLAVGFTKDLTPPWTESFSLPWQGNLGRNEKLLHRLVQGNLVGLILGCPSQPIEEQS